MNKSGYNIYKDMEEIILDYNGQEEEDEEYLISEEENIYKDLLYKYDKVMFLYLFTDNEELKSLYDKSIDKHNNNILNNNFLDAGFDLFNPQKIECINDNDKLVKVDLNIKCSAKIYTDSWKNYYTGYYIYPRSSIIKTPLRLANSVGIIDSGYRNNIIAAFDLNDNYTIEKHSRLIQLCSPSLCPIYVIRVDSEDMLSELTIRNLGGFGSTGI